ncbi:MAG: Nif3-like dinuclear metal center hexameric protein [Eubacterium sp.]|jgi:dinuclear metal center YbgI/SA1388 family protein|nr:Nif3-like dinuclear metal center hexameric protein [Eubacterium sp.]
MTIYDYLKFLDKIAPFETQDNYDNSGFIIGDLKADVKSVLLCLDITNSVVEEAAERGVDLIISHHPVIFNPMKKIEKSSPVHKVIRYGISVIAAHTNFDITHMPSAMLKRLGFSDKAVIEAQPIKPFGLIAELPAPLSANDILVKIKSAFLIETLRYTKGKEKIRRVAVCSGAGADLAEQAYEMGADLFICGDIRRHHFIDAMNRGFMLVDAGHYGTEFIFCEYLKNLILKEFPNEKIYITERDIDAVSFI